MRRMDVLVTGAGGFVGRHLVRALVQRGHAVRAMSRAPLEEGADAGVRTVVADLDDAQRLAPAVAGADVVYHVAAVVPGRGSGARMWSTNVEGTHRLAVACRSAGVRRLVLVSSVSVYRAPLNDVVPESAPVGGVDLYGRSKSEAESTVRRVCGDELQLVVARPCQIYGPMDRSGYTQRLLRLTGLPVLPMAGWHGHAFSLIHVSDVADALCAAGETPDIGSSVFNLAPASRVSLPQLAQARAGIDGRHRGVRLPLPETAVRAALSMRWALRHMRREGEPVLKSYAPGHTHGSLLLGGPLYDCENARRTLAFRPARTLEQGLAELLADDGEATAQPRARPRQLDGLR